MKVLGVRARLLIHRHEKDLETHILSKLFVESQKKNDAERQKPQKPPRYQVAGPSFDMWSAESRRAGVERVG